MLTLALDSSGRAASCALFDGERLLAESFMDVGLTHSQTLLPLLERTLLSAGVKIGDLDRLAVSVGPGSFTGVRIGVSTIKGLAFGLDIPCVGVSTLAALACYPAGLCEGPVCPVMDARAGQVYSALFEVRGDNIARRMEDAALPVEELRRLLPEGSLLVGDGAHLLYSPDGPFRMAPAHLRLQRAVGVALAARDLPGVSADRLAPIYLRRPQAERQRAERLAAQQNSGAPSPHNEERNGS